MNILPPEIIFKILAPLDCIHIHQLRLINRYLASVYHSWDFWAYKAKYDLDVPGWLFNDTSLLNPYSRYNQLKTNLQEYVWYHYHHHIDEYVCLSEAAETGNLDAVKYFLHYGFKNKDLWDYPVGCAQLKNQTQIVDYFVALGFPKELVDVST